MDQFQFELDGDLPHNAPTQDSSLQNMSPADSFQPVALASYHHIVPSLPTTDPQQTQPPADTHPGLKIVNSDPSSPPVGTHQVLTRSRQHQNVLPLLDTLHVVSLTKQHQRELVPEHHSDQSSTATKSNQGISFHEYYIHQGFVPSSQNLPQPLVEYSSQVSTYQTPDASLPLLTSHPAQSPGVFPSLPFLRISKTSDGNGWNPINPNPNPPIDDPDAALKPCLGVVSGGKPSGDYPQSLCPSERTCCRICQEDDSPEALISPCHCIGSVGFMHFSCLQRWLQSTCRTNCELCSHPFPVQKQLPSFWQYLRSPSQNMDMPSLLCDVSCFFLLTPLLIASTYLCSMGVTHYQGSGKSESAFAVVTLMVSLISVYCAWATLALLYHRRVWLTWRDQNSIIRLLAHEMRDPQMPAKSLEQADGDSLGTQLSCRTASSQQSNTSGLLQLLSRGRKFKVTSHAEAVEYI